jgi:hypothetical protein
MKIVVTIEDEKYEYKVPVDFPDAEQFMHAIEQVINKVGYPEKDIEDYIVAWADEIKNTK